MEFYDSHPLTSSSNSSCHNNNDGDDDDDDNEYIQEEDNTICDMEVVRGDNHPMKKKRTTSSPSTCATDSTTMETAEECMNHRRSSTTSSSDTCTADFTPMDTAEGTTKTNQCSSNSNSSTSVSSNTNDNNGCCYCRVHLNPKTQGSTIQEISMAFHNNNNHHNHRISKEQKEIRNQEICNQLIDFIDDYVARELRIPNITTAAGRKPQLSQIHTEHLLQAANLYLFLVHLCTRNNLLYTNYTGDYPNDELYEIVLELAAKRKLYQEARTIIYKFITILSTINNRPISKTTKTRNVTATTPTKTKPTQVMQVPSIFYSLNAECAEAMNDIQDANRSYRLLHRIEKQNKEPYCIYNKKDPSSILNSTRDDDDDKTTTFLPLPGTIYERIARTRR